MPPTDRPDPVRAPEALIRRLAFHGRHLPGSPVVDSDLRDPKECRNRLRMGGRVDPLRFVPLLEIIRSDPHIPNPWAASILQGVAERLLGNPVEDPTRSERIGSLAGQPPPDSLAQTLREWLTADSPLWAFPPVAADAILAAISPHGPRHPSCEPNADLTAGLLRLAGDSHPEIPDGPADASGGVRGRTARAAVLLAAQHGDAGRPLPPLLENLLFRLAADRHAAVVLALVQALTELAKISPNLAWRLFRASSRPGMARIFPAAETFLQTRMADEWGHVRPVLRRLKQAEMALDAEGWASALVHASRAGQLVGQSLIEALSALPLPETGLAILKKIFPRHGGPALDFPLFIALTETPGPPPPLADRLMGKFSEAAPAETVPLDALFRMAYNLLKMLDRTSGAAGRAPFFQGLAHLAERAPRMASVLLDSVQEAGNSGALIFSPAERDTTGRIAGKIARRIDRSDRRHPTIPKPRF